MLSSSKAEWVTLSEAVKEAIFMASNITTIPCTKHVDIKYQYVNKYVEDAAVKIIFVQSAENDSDILTKNLSVELHEKHLRKMIGEKFE